MEKGSRVSRREKWGRTPAARNSAESGIHHQPSYHNQVLHSIANASSASYEECTYVPKPQTLNPKPLRVPLAPLKDPLKEPQVSNPKAPVQRKVMAAQS